MACPLQGSLYFALIEIVMKNPGSPISCNKYSARVNFNLHAWQRLRNIYADQNISSFRNLQNIIAGLLLSSIERMAYHHTRHSADQPDPIFVIGHWRSGTTFLHELLCSNPHFNFPTTYACMNPHVFPLTEPSVLHYASKRPVLRPMDNMPISLASPQEDEFALLALGARSPYEGLLFPKATERGFAAADPCDLPESEMQEWVYVFTRFIDQVSRRKPGCPVVLKSPTHSYRVALLSRLFPTARFIHIVRNPLEVYNSTLYMWQKLCSLYALTKLPEEGVLSGKVIANWVRLEEKLDVALPRLAKERYIQVRYEDLVIRPAEVVERIYTRLDLGKFAVALPHLDRYVKQASSFTGNSFTLQPRDAVLLMEGWGHIFNKYGYATKLN